MPESCSPTRVVRNFHPPVTARRSSASYSAIQRRVRSARSRPPPRHTRPNVGWPLALRQAVDVEEQPQPLEHAPRQRGRGVAHVAQRRPQSRRARQVPDRRARPREVEVDQRDRAPAGEDDVVEVRVVVADEAAPERLRHRRRPAVRGRVEGRDGVVVAAQQLGDAGECVVGQRPGRVRLDRRLSGDVAQHLAPALVDPEEAGRAVEADPLEVLEQRVLRRARGVPRAAHGVADAGHEPGVREAAFEQDLARLGHRAHGSATSAVAIAVCVTRLLTSPPSSPALTAGAFSVP